MMQSLPQIVAAELGLRPDDVVVRQADTDAAGYDVGIGGGRQPVSLGAASTGAGRDKAARGRALDRAARHQGRRRRSPARCRTRPAKAVRELPMTPPRVLELLLGTAQPLTLGHIANSWRENVLSGGGERRRCRLRCGVGEVTGENVEGWRF